MDCRLMFTEYPVINLIKYIFIYIAGNNIIIKKVRKVLEDVVKLNCHDSLVTN